MRPLTDISPKPLLEIGGKALIIYLMEALRDHGFTELVINHAHLGEQIVERLGDGKDFGVSIQYSDESSGGLETGGGILKALPLLGDDPFLVVNGDIWTDYPFSQLVKGMSGKAHLVLVGNPSHHLQGDFHLAGHQVLAEGQPRLTYSGIGVYDPAMFRHCKQRKFPLAPLLRAAMVDGLVSGEYYKGEWSDIGTLERLQSLEQKISS